MNSRIAQSSKARHKYESLYFKKLQTQSSTFHNNQGVSSDLFSPYGSASNIIEKQIEKIHRNLHHKHSTFNKALHNKAKLQEQSKSERESLRKTIEEKMRNSQTNILKYREKSTSSLSSRLKSEAKKVEEIKKMERSMFDEKYRKAKQFSLSQEKFFLEKEKEEQNRKRTLSGHSVINTTTKGSFLLQRKRQKRAFKFTNDIRNPQSPSRSNKSLTYTPKKVLPSVLHVSQQTIEQKQNKKRQNEETKESSFLREHIRKMKLIQENRNRIKMQRKLPEPTKPKQIDRFTHSDLDTYHKKNRIESQKGLNNIVNSRSSFTDMYKRRLNDKKQKKNFFLSQSIANGDRIVKKQAERSSQYKLNRIIRDSQNQLIRKGNLRYMERRYM